ncbi:putative inorganic phosphate cotransporter [Bactrocera neohumeralis]|uniref:putative inorganic phosphate cotransporter n=1 Tax=Bactrocera tryoni TaxID=59916 RepID=UPI001A97B648|nr:putative inorganic phosphate cotransporter [Bactrocera tryoni]XP_050318669.1 putative inorganic phosphate cotransporter [Bactrocera neohumeralis]
METLEDKRPEWGKKLSQMVPIPQRVIMSIMGFLSIINNYTLRSCISVTITRLVLERKYSNETTASGEVCPKPDITIEEEKIPGGEYDWSQELQGYILGSFYIGYIIGHVPAGLLAEKYGAKWVLVCGMSTVTILTLLTPLCITLLGPYALIVLRSVMGFGAGFSYPSCSALLAHWVPVHERSLLGAFIMGGGQMGTVLSNSISGTLLRYTTWPWVFYTFGIMATLWILFFIMMCFSDPNSHPYISDKEKEYLLKHMGRLGRDHNLPPFPWIPVFKSKEMWVLILAQIAHDWGFYVMSSCFPKFLNDVLQLQILKTGIYSSIPFLLFWLSSLLLGAIADCIIKRNVTRATCVRKWMTFIAATPSGLFMVIAVYIGCDTVWIILCFSISMALMGGFYAGIKLTANDMTPNYSATVMAIVNGIGGIAGVLAPYSVGWITVKTLLHEWQEVFWLALAILTLPTIPFCIWGTAEVQEWNEPPKKE